MPSILMLSALDGVGTTAPTLTPYVFQDSLAILSAIFMIQPLSTTTVGKAFGLIMTLGFGAIEIVAIVARGMIYRHPGSMKL